MLKGDYEPKGVTAQELKRLEEITFLAIGTAKDV